ncbi:response regulator [Segnochrobactrum spirostomi]|uniref:Response regulator n=1 Tax=Segnochrobactrum spirostomi TaxID=2608987 RepID=A0A6A7Y0T4_9HYPH|nr:response regulator [Segnochrobactrum spirostomi]MQT12098.1 response regulator [Segnochrobactrum spirostomi]
MLTKPSAVGEATLGGHRIFLVEDEALVLMLLEDILTDLGCTIVGPASRLAEALAIATDPTAAMDAAVLDVNIRGEAVFPVAEALAARGVPFAFATGYGAAGLPEQWRDRPVLPKPFDQADVARVIAHALAGTGSV